MHFTLAEIIDLIIAYKYVILFPLLVIEGPIVTIIAGFLTTPEMAYLSIVPLFFLVLVADLVGDLFYYSIGRWGRKSVVFRLARKLGLTEERFLKLEDHFKKHGGKTIAIGKIGHGIGWGTMMAAGATRMKLPKFFGVNILVSIPKSALLIFLGYYYGESYEKINSYFQYGGFVLSAVLIVGIVIYFTVRRYPPSVSS